MENKNDNKDNDHKISSVSRQYLKETAKWGKFMGILGFIFAGFIAVAGLFAGTLFSAFPTTESMPFSFPSALFSIIYLILAIIYFIPSWYLYKFSTNLKASLEVDEVESLELAFKNQKSLFKFMGIVTIVILALYGLGFIVGIIIGVAS